MHPGADPVSGKRPQEDSFASRVRQAHVTRQSEKADSLLRRVEPRILSSLGEESIRFLLAAVRSIQSPWKLLTEVRVLHRAEVIPGKKGGAGEMDGKNPAARLAAVRKYPEKPANDEWHGRL